MGLRDASASKNHRIPWIVWLPLKTDLIKSDRCLSKTIDHSIDLEFLPLDRSNLRPHYAWTMMQKNKLIPNWSCWPICVFIVTLRYFLLKLICWWMFVLRGMVLPSNLVIKELKILWIKWTEENISFWWNQSGFKIDIFECHNVTYQTS